MGMAFPSLSVYNMNPMFQTLVTQGITTQPVFAFKLAQAGSELFLGGDNPSLYQGSFVNVPVTTPVSTS
jgi:cathepsin D